MSSTVSHEARNALRAVRDLLKIRVNPEYDPEDTGYPKDVDDRPHDANEFMLVNHVQLANKVIILANAHTEVTSAMSEAIEEKKHAKKRLSEVEAKVEDRESRLIADEPLAPSEAKSLKTIEAAVRSRAHRKGYDQILDEWREQIRQLKSTADECEADIRQGEVWAKAAITALDASKTYLAWFKDERKFEPNNRGSDGRR